MVVNHLQPTLAVGDAPDPPGNVSTATGDVPGSYSYAPPFGAPDHGSKAAPDLFQANLEAVQQGLEITKATAISQLAILSCERQHTNAPIHIIASRVEEATGTPFSKRIKHLLL